MPAKKDVTKEEIIEKADGKLTYKGRTLVRNGNIMVYGNVDDPFIVMFEVKSSKKVQDLEVSDQVVITLMMNSHNGDITKNRPIKRAVRDNIYEAFDTGAYWLEDAVKNNK